MQLSVNGVSIADERIAEEVAQHADAASPEEAACRALVVRELMRQRAVALQLAPDDGGLSDEAVDALLENEVSTPEADSDACRRYYETHREQFRQGDLVAASHILFAISAGTPLAMLREKAETTLAAVIEDPTQFETLAKEVSNCPSGQVGGSLGQLQRGDAVPEFEAALFADAGTGIRRQLVNTRFGFHILRVDQRVAGKLLPFEIVQPRIARFLAERVRHKAIQQYLTLLASQARIEGVSFETVNSPLLP
jgi:peptidyl-prolyl cis-trans isomerase C